MAYLQISISEIYIISMPSRNTARQDIPNNYYHVYARGASKTDIFLEPKDKDFFLYLFSRHLDLKPITNKSGITYPHYRDRVEVLAFCLMDNHFHLLVYQVEQGYLSKLMKSIMSAYSSYFNRKYKKTGSLFESRYKASLINKDAYLLHISRYIHLNPRSWKYFPYSSFVHIRNGTEPVWLQTEKVLCMFSGRNDYLEFVSDYEGQKQILDELKHELADL